MVRVRAAARARTARRLSRRCAHVAAILVGAVHGQLRGVISLHPWLDVRRLVCGRVATHGLGAAVALPHLVSLIVTVVEKLIVLLQVGEAFSLGRLLSAVPGRLAEC